MTDCEAHLRYGMSIHMVLVAIMTLGYVGGVVHLGILATATSTLPLTLTGAVFPDLDHPSSIPYRYGKRFLPSLLAGVAVLVGLRYRIQIAAALIETNRSGFGTFLSGVIVASLGWGTWIGTYGLFPVLRPPHRTVTHRLSAGVIAALCVGAVVSLLVGGDGSLRPGERVFVLGSSVAFLLGFASHLAADGLLHK